MSLVIATSKFHSMVTNSKILKWAVVCNHKLNFSNSSFIQEQLTTTQFKALAFTRPLFATHINYMYQNSVLKTLVTVSYVQTTLQILPSIIQWSVRLRRSSFVCHPVIIVFQITRHELFLPSSPPAKSTILPSLKLGAYHMYSN